MVYNELGGNIKMYASISNEKQWQETPNIV